ncbi:hypothetical protein ACLM5H_02945 [Fredinandcohnia humi]
MDKRKEQISIKINGKEQKVTEGQHGKKPFTRLNVENQHTINVVENEEIAVAREEEEDDFNWVLPDESFQRDSSPEIQIPVIPIEDLRKSKGSSKIPKLPKRSKGIQVFTMKQFLVSILLAIVLGTGFGMMILKVVGDVSTQPAGTETPPVSTEDPPSSGIDDKEEPKGSTGASIEIAPLTTGIIQGGKFSTVESANTIVSQIKSGGYAATSVEQEGAFFVFMGIGVDSGQISALEAEYESTSFEYFGKNLTLEGGSFTTSTKEDSEAIKEALPFFQEMLSLSSQAFQSGTISDEAWGKLLNSNEKMKEIKQENLTEDLKNFSTHLTNAFNSLQSFKGNGDKKVLWQSQQSLLDAYKSYSSWIAQLS